MKRQFKLIKKYPGSPETPNFVITFKEGFPIVYPAEAEAGCNCMVSLDYCIKYPEFWKEIKVPEYQILQAIRKNDGKIENVDPNDQTINDCWEIYSFKRLSDGMIFTLGDYINLENWDNHDCKLKKIIQMKAGLDLIITQKASQSRYGISVGQILDKFTIIEPIIKTFDGVDLFVGDTVYYIYAKPEIDYTIRTSKVGIHTPESMPDILDFSTSEAAQQWIEKQKYLFTTEDGVKIYNLNHPQLWWVHIKTFNIGIDYKNTLKTPDIVNYKYYSTEKAAKTYIYLNSPVYSIQDIKNAVQTRCGQWTITTGDDLVLVDLGKLCK